MREPVVFILDRFDDASAGTESQIVLLLRLLDRTRFTPRVALLRGPDGLSRYVDDVRVDVLDIGPIRSPRSWNRAWRFARSARRGGGRIAHIWFNDASVLFPFPLWLAGFRVVVSRRDLGFWYTPALLRLLRLAGRFVDAVVCNADAVRRAVVAQERLPERRTVVIYNGIAREQTSATSEQERVHMGVPPGAFLVTAVANLRPLKRMDTIIQAIARVRRLVPEIHLIIAGADRPGTSCPSHREELEHLTHSLGVAERVHFMGAISDPMTLLDCSDAAVLASETEGLSNSIIEYLLAGRPVLCTPVGGARELVDEGITGYFFDVGDDAALARHLVNLHDDPDLLRKMGQHAQAAARARFDPRILVSSHERLYEHLLRTRGAQSWPLPAERSLANTLRDST